MMRLLYNTDTAQLLPHPRQDGKPAEDLQPPLIELVVIDETATSPAYDPLTEALERSDVVSLETGTVTLGWRVISLQEAPPPDYEGFWRALLTSQVYQSVCAQADTSPAVARRYSDFGLALSVAVSGRPIIESLQASLWSVLSVTTLTPEHLAELQGLLEQTGLAALLTLERPPE